MNFARKLEPDNKYIDVFLNNYRSEHIFSTLRDERKVNPYLRFNEKSIIGLLKKNGLPYHTEWERWQSLMSIE
jgi:hydroxyacylglutathione hydrolase